MSASSRSAAIPSRQRRPEARPAAVAARRCGPAAARSPRRAAVPSASAQLAPASVRRARHRARARGASAGARAPELDRRAIGRPALVAVAGRRPRLVVCGTMDEPAPRPASVAADRLARLGRALPPPPFVDSSGAGRPGRVRPAVPARRRPDRRPRSSLGLLLWMARDSVRPFIVGLLFVYLLDRRSAGWSGAVCAGRSRSSSSTSVGDHRLLRVPVADPRPR